jgi:single-strand DNA-binding protein
MDINVSIVSGNLTADPVVHHTDDEKIVGKFRIASQRPRGNDGEDRGADFVDVTVFGQQAENCGRYLAKGRKVLVKGRLHHSEWDSGDGRRQRLEVIADPLGVQFLTRKPDGQQEEPEPVADATA